MFSQPRGPACRRFYSPASAFLPSQSHRCPALTASRKVTYAITAQISPRSWLLLWSDCISCASPRFSDNPVTMSEALRWRSGAACARFYSVPTPSQPGAISEQAFFSGPLARTVYCEPEKSCAHSLINQMHPESGSLDLRFKQYERKSGQGPSAVLTAVSQVSPIKVYFPISKQEYLRMADDGGPGSVDWLTHASRIPLRLTWPTANRREVRQSHGSERDRTSAEKFTDN